MLVASGDRDTFQLASDKTTILYPVRAGEVARIGPAEVRARYGVEPEQVPDFIALRGDPSDKLPGAPGVGAARRGGRCCENTEAWTQCLKAGRFPASRGAAALSLDRHHGPQGAGAAPAPIRRRPGRRRPRSRGNGSSISLPSASRR